MNVTEPYFPKESALITTQPRVGVGAILHDGPRVILGLRQGSHGAGEWSFPGGALEPGEHPLICAQRETYEETGILAQPYHLLGHTSNDLYRAENKHFVTLYVKLRWDGTAPEVMEPEKCVEWAEFDWDDLPQPLFAGIGEMKQLGFRL